MPPENHTHETSSFPHPFTLAIDDSDTPWGGCTTHLSWLLLKQISRNILLIDYPLLIRLNPVVPRKTRGNAAVVVRGYSRIPHEELLEIAASEAESYTSRRPPGKGPGVALYKNIDAWRVPQLRTLYHRSLTTYIPRSIAVKVAGKTGVSVIGGPGVVGAVASLAGLAPGDPYTYELIAYRKPENMGRERCVERDPHTGRGEPLCSIANYDLLEGKLASAPGGPDPVLAGFRGLDPSCLGAMRRVLCEEPDGWTLYRSNQHTGVHGIQGSLRPLPYNYVAVRGRVAGDPIVLPGGHVIVELETAWGRVTAAFYRETGPLREVASRLMRGDIVVVEGGVVPRSMGPTLAADVLQVEGLTRVEEAASPRCPRCGSRMKSVGRGKGYRCVRCGYRDPAATPIHIEVPRRLVPGRYTPSVSYARHLTRFNWWTPNSSFKPRLMRVECAVSYDAMPPASVLGDNC